jgi:hypothetical protein
MHNQMGLPIARGLPSLSSYKQHPTVSGRSIDTVAHSTDALQRFGYHRSEAADAKMDSYLCEMQIRIRTF